MNLWFDLSNSPHINLFADLLAELGKRHALTVTCRDLANTVALLRLHGIEHHVVGEHHGAQLHRKLAGYPVRVNQLRNFLRDRGIDVAVSQSSFHSPVVARLLGIPSIYMNDNEHAAGNIPAFATATQVWVPEYLSDRSLRRQFASQRKVRRYPGVKEGIYLWRAGDRIQVRRRQRRAARPAVWLRPEPSTAQYYRGARNVLDDVILGLRPYADVTVLPRGDAQAKHYADGRFEGVRVISGAIALEDIAVDCDLFVGAGGTMTREMAVLGVPTISVYQDTLLDVDRWLLARGAFEHRPALTSPDALAALERAVARPPDRDLLDRGRCACDALREAIVELPAIRTQGRRPAGLAR